LIAETMFRRLSERDSGRRYKRAPAKVSVICGLAGCGTEELDAVGAPFEASGASFLERRDDPADPLLDLSHEALIRQWPRLCAWTDEEAKKKETFRELARAAREWDHKGRRSAFLKTGGQLTVMNDWWRAQRPTAAWASRYRDAENPASSEESVGDVRLRQFAECMI
jgi:hypothetical protein